MQPVSHSYVSCFCSHLISHLCLVKWRTQQRRHTMRTLKARRKCRHCIDWMMTLLVYDLQWLMINQICEVCLEVSLFCLGAVLLWSVCPELHIRIHQFKLLRSSEAPSSIVVMFNQSKPLSTQSPAAVIWLVWIRPTVWKKDIISDFD